MKDKGMPKADFVMGLILMALITFMRSTPLVSANKLHSLRNKGVPNIWYRIKRKNPVYPNCRGKQISCETSILCGDGSDRN